MNLYVINNKYWFELENLTRLFFPNEKINVYKTDEPVSSRRCPTRSPSGCRSAAGIGKKPRP